MDYQYKTKPYQHQAEAFMRSRDCDVFAYLMEMGTGKTKVALDNAAWLWANGHVDTLIVAAPHGVHRNWVLREIPVHLPDWTRYRVAAWSSTMTKAEERAVQALLEPRTKFNGLRILCINLEAFSVPKKSYDAKAGKLIRTLLNAFHCMFVVDESSMIKTPGASRTKRLQQLSQHAAIRRILTGTAITNSPLDAFTQFRWLDPTILGFSNFYSFKNHYAEWEEGQTRSGQRYPVLVGYKNLDELTDRIHAYSVRVLKRDCLDLPEKIYVTRELKMAEKQAKIYRRVREECLIEMDGEDHFIDNVLEKMVRLQQVLGGFFPKSDPAGSDVPIFDEPARYNPKVVELLSLIDEAPDSPFIIYSSYQPEIRMLKQVLGDRAVTYYGPNSDKEREDAIDRFQAGDVQFFIGSRAAMYGLTLTAAEYVVYYSNSYRLDDRLQSEDRAHRLGLKHPVTYIDLVFPGTADTKAIAALRAKKQVADVINRDQPSAWL